MARFGGVLCGIFPPQSTSMTMYFFSISSALLRNSRRKSSPRSPKISRISQFLPADQNTLSLLCQSPVTACGMQRQRATSLHLPGLLEQLAPSSPESGTQQRELELLTGTKALNIRQSTTITTVNCIQLLPVRAQHPAIARTEYSLQTRNSQYVQLVGSPTTYRGRKTR